MTSLPGRRPVALAAHALLTLGFLLALAPTAVAQAADPSELEIQLLTISPGPELFTGFGHTAVRVIDHGARTDRVYDYGAYDSADPEMAQKFLVGELPYWVTEMSFRGSVFGFQIDFGGMYAQTLAFTPEQARAVAAKLTHDVLPENRYYRYHHFRDNCATRLRDIFDEVLDGALARSAEGPADGDTFRTLIEAALHRAPHLRWPVYGLLNGDIDIPLGRWERMFLPVHLMDELDKVQLTAPDGTRYPLVSARKQLWGTAPPFPPQPSLLPWLLLLLGLVILLGVPAALPWPRLARVWTGSWLALLGLAGACYGAIMVLLWVLAPYVETTMNAHLFVLHPLHLALVPLSILAALGRPRGVRLLRGYLLLQLAVAGLALALRLLGLVVHRIEGFALPVMAVCGAAWVTLWRHGPRETPRSEPPA